MLLTRLKELREQQGLSLRGLASKSKVPYSAISLLENGKREPQGRTARKLAQALEVEVTNLYGQEPVVLEQKHTPTISALMLNGNKTQTIIKLARSNKSKAKLVISFWVIEKDQEEGDPFNVGSQAEAERLKAWLGLARIYQSATKFEALELHRQFLIRVARGHEAWDTHA